MKCSHAMSAVLFCASVLSVSAASAHKAPLRVEEMAITCFTGHGVTIEANRTHEVKTQWGLAEKSFRLAAYVESTRWGMMTHIHLKPVDTLASPYDIYLWGQPQPLSKSIHYGQIGMSMKQSRRMKKVDPHGLLSFVPVSSITCTIDQER